MEQTQPVNGMSTTGVQLPIANKSRFVPFNEHERETILKAHQAFVQVVTIVASCKGLKNCHMNEEMTGFMVDD